MNLFVYESICGGDCAGRPLPPSLASEGWKMLSSIVEDLAQVHYVERVRTLLDERFGGRDRAWGPKVEVAAWCRSGPAAEKFSELAAAADATLVIAPETDGLLENWSARVLSAGGKLLGSLPAAVRLAGDKLILARHLRSRGIPTPPLHELNAIAGVPPPRGLTFPQVLKPRFGAGCLWTFKVDDEAKLRAALASARRRGAPRELVTGPFVPGIAASASFLISGNQVTALVPGYQRISVSPGGLLHYCGGRIPLETAELRRRAVDLARRAVWSVPGLQGFAGVDLALEPRSPGQDAVIEINPRLTTSYIGLRQLHRRWDIARKWLEARFFPEKSVDASLEAPWEEHESVEFTAA
ncbi:MAG: ATP-grasp domain-containing protein [Planctomycetes bacterium]|nr:ATP-grasp domain-containing protein [Planctomycetota bacterium]